LAKHTAEIACFRADFTASAVLRPQQGQRDGEQRRLAAVRGQRSMPGELVEVAKMLAPHGVEYVEWV